MKKLFTYLQLIFFLTTISIGNLNVAMADPGPDNNVTLNEFLDATRTTVKLDFTGVDTTSFYDATYTFVPNDDNDEITGSFENFNGEPVDDEGIAEIKFEQALVTAGAIHITGLNEYEGEYDGASIEESDINLSTSLTAALTEQIIEVQGIPSVEATGFKYVYDPFDDPVDNQPQYGILAVVFQDLEYTPSNDDLTNQIPYLNIAQATITQGDTIVPFTEVSGWEISGENIILLLKVNTLDIERGQDFTISGLTFFKQDDESYAYTHPAISVEWQVPEIQSAIIYEVSGPIYDEEKNKYEVSFDIKACYNFDFMDFEESAPNRIWLKGIYEIGENDANWEAQGSILPYTEANPNLVFDEENFNVMTGLDKEESPLPCYTGEYSSNAISEEQLGALDNLAENPQDYFMDIRVADDDHDLDELTSPYVWDLAVQESLDDLAGDASGTAGNPVIETYFEQTDIDTANFALKSSFWALNKTAELTTINQPYHMTITAQSNLEEEPEDPQYLCFLPLKKLDGSYYNSGCYEVEMTPDVEALANHFIIVNELETNERLSVTFKSCFNAPVNLNEIADNTVKMGWNIEIISLWVDEPEATKISENCLSSTAYVNENTLVQVPGDTLEDQITMLTSMFNGSMKLGGVTFNIIYQQDPNNEEIALKTIMPEKVVKPGLYGLRETANLTEATVSLATASKNQIRLAATQEVTNSILRPKFFYVLKADESSYFRPNSVQFNSSQIVLDFTNSLKTGDKLCAVGLKFNDNSFSETDCFNLSFVSNTGKSSSGYKKKDEELTYEQEVAEVLARGIVTKNPTDVTNKCEALTMLSRVFDWDMSEAPNQVRYTDVPEWCVKVAAFATEQGIVEGRTPTLLGMNSPMNRFEAAVIIYRELQKQNYKFTSQIAEVNFKDELVDWAEEAVTTFVKEGTIKGYENGNFGGVNGILKQDFGVILLRFIMN